MNLPKISDTLNGYKFEWLDEKIVINVSRIKEHSNGDISSEIKIETTDPQFNAHLHQAKFNLNADKSREYLAKRLSGNHNGLLDVDQWIVILEQLCVKTMERIRVGAPIQRLTINDDIKAPNYLLYPLLIENYVNVLFGDPGSSKSTLSMIICQILQLPWDDNPIGLLPPLEPQKCLYLDWESDNTTFNWQLKMLQKGMDMPEQCIYMNYRHCALPLVSDFEQIHRHVKESGANVIIIDSLGLAAGGELNESKSPIEFYTYLRKLNVTSLVLAHNSKDRETKSRTIYGNQYFTAQARNIWEIRKEQEPNSDIMNIALYHRKPPPFHKLQKAIGIKIIFDNEFNTMSLQSMNPKNIPEFLEQMGVQARILDLLKNCKMKPKDIAESLNIKSGHVRNALFNLKEQKKVIKIGEEYGLLQIEETVND